MARRVKDLAPRAAILMLSQDASAEVVGEALDAGALGYVHKQRAQRELLTAIASVLAGKRFVSDGVLGGDSRVGTKPHSHRVLFFSNDSELLLGLGRFIANAISLKNPVLSLVTQSHRDSLIQQLKNDRLDIEGAMARGWCVWFDADDAPDAAQLSAALLLLTEGTSNASAVSPPHISLCGELAGRLWADGKTNEAMEIERLCDELARVHDLEVLCAYPTDRGLRATEDSDAISEMHSTALSN